MRNRVFALCSWCLLSVILYFEGSVVLGGNARVTTSSIWPMPKSAQFGSDTYEISTSFAFQTSVNSTILRNAFERYEKLIFSTPLYLLPRKQVSGFSLETLTVSVQNSSEILQITTDESYSLIISTPGANLKALTVFGALRGLESFSQLVKFNTDTQQYEMLNQPATIVDAPRFAHRGFMLDTSRHFIPISMIKILLDSLPYAKLNVFHWHIVDIQSFPLQSKKYPLLWKGSWSESERYTQSAIKDVVAYALERGVRVIVELDGPGHAYSWGFGYPQLLPADYAKNPACKVDFPHLGDVPLDPSNDFTFTLLKELYGELLLPSATAILPDNYFHLGGDEVNYACWSSSPQIKEWMKKMKFTSFDDVYLYFINKTNQYVKDMGKMIIRWDDVFTLFANVLDKSSLVIEISNLVVNPLSKVVAKGFQAILTGGSWYLNSQIPRPWQEVYQVEPYVNITDPAQQKLILGGEGCLWTPHYDASNAISSIWPDLAAIAERLWSPQNINNATHATSRLHSFRCLLNTRGIPSSPLNSNQTVSEPKSCFVA